MCHSGAKIIAQAIALSQLGVRNHNVTHYIKHLKHLSHSESGCTCQETAEPAFVSLFSFHFPIIFICMHLNMFPLIIFCFYIFPLIFTILFFVLCIIYTERNTMF